MKRVDGYHGLGPRERSRTEARGFQKRKFVLMIRKGAHTPAKPLPNISSFSNALKDCASEFDPFDHGGSFSVLSDYLFFGAMLLAA